MASQILKEFIITSLQRQQGATCPTSDYDLRYDPENGNVDVVRRVGINIFNQPDLNDPCEYIFRNGSFTQNAVTTFGQQNVNKLYQQIKDEVKRKRAVLGGTAGGAIKPAFLDIASAPIVGTPTNLPTPAPPTNNGGITGANGGLLGGGAPITFPSENEKDLFGERAKNEKLLIYPYDLLDSQQDVFKITQFNYQSPSGKDFLSGNIKDIITRGLQRNSALKTDFKGTVILPMPNDAKDNNSVSWGPDSMNNLTAAVMSKVATDPMGTLGAIAGGQATQAAAGFNSAQLIFLSQMFADVGGIDSLQSQGLQTQLKAALTSIAAKQVGFEIPPETILARGLGIVPNANLELLFNSPTLREFSFGYRMTPRSQIEAKSVRRIIRFFKQGMAPRKLNAASGAGAGSVFLGTPNVFKLEYKSGNKSIKGLNRFKICALTGFSVNYTPDSQWAAYDDEQAPGQPVSVTMGMSFTEIEPVFESDYQENIFKNETTDLTQDLDPIGPDDVGY